VYIPCKPNSSHELACIPGPMAPETGLVHWRRIEEFVFVDETSGVTARSAYVAFSTGCMTVHAIEVEHFSQPFVGIVQSLFISTEVDERIGKSTYCVVQRFLICARCLIMTLRTNTVGIA
jgi:hypothetical protein